MRDVAKMMVESLSSADMATSRAGSVLGSHVSDSEISSSRTNRAYLLNGNLDDSYSYHNYSTTLDWPPLDSPGHAPTTSLLTNGGEFLKHERVSNFLRPL